MPHLHLYDVGERVVLSELSAVEAVIKSKTSSTVSVDVIERHTGKRYETTWGPLTVVHKWFPPANQPTPAPSQPEPTTATPTPSPKASKPEKAAPKADKPPAENKPKGKPEVDVFGVRKGTMAAAVNEFLLQKRTKITVADVLANVAGSKKDNVVSHLRRMVRDNLIVNKGKDKDLLVDVPKGVK